MSSAMRESPPRASRTARPSGRAVREALTGWGLALPATILVAVFFLLPFAMNIVLSFFDWPTFGTPEFTGIDNYSDVLTDPDFGRAVVFTVGYTLGCSALGVVVSLGLALLVRPKFTGRTAIRTILFAPFTIGFAPAGLLWLALSNTRTGVLPAIAIFFGLAPQGTDWFADTGSTLVLVIIMTIWKTIGLTMLVLIIGMDSIPAEIYEAARLDGARAWTTLTRITLPLIAAPLSLVILLTVTTTFLGFDQFFTLTEGGPNNSTVTIVYYLYNAAFVNLDRGYAAAVAVVIVVIMAAVSVLQVRLQRGKGSTP